MRGGKDEREEREQEELGTCGGKEIRFGQHYSGQVCGVMSLLTSHCLRVEQLASPPLEFL